MAGEIGAPADALLGSVPKTSRAASPGAMAGEIGAPADALLGSVPKTSRAASPGATSKAALVPVIAPDAARSVYPVPLLSMLRSSGDSCHCGHGLGT
jgi:hypothetical protein